MFQEIQNDFKNIHVKTVKFCHSKSLLWVKILVWEVKPQKFDFYLKGKV